MNTDGAQSAAEGAGQAQYEIGPERSLSGAAAATPTPSPAGGSLPATAADTRRTPTSALAALVPLVALGVAALGGRTMCVRD